MLSSSRWNTHNSVIINAPIDEVWNALVDINDWEWNLWTRLDARVAATGEPGILKASYDGNSRWKTFDFVFEEVNSEKHILKWTASVGKSLRATQTHIVQLDALDVKRTCMRNIGTFTGILALLGLGLPYKKLNRNEFLMCEEFKNYVESKYFNSVLFTLSARSSARSLASTVYTDCITEGSEDVSRLPYNNNITCQPSGNLKRKFVSSSSCHEPERTPEPRQRLGIHQLRRQLVQ